MILVENGADPDCVDQSFGHPLSRVIAGKNLALAQFLLEHGANPNGPADCWEPPIVAAAGVDHLPLTKNLLSRGADLLKRGSKVCDDVLCGPVFHGNVQLVKILIAKGANVNCVFRPNREMGRMWAVGETLLGHAISEIVSLKEFGYEYPSRIAELLIQAGADVNQPSRWFVRRTKGQKVWLDAAPIPPVRIAAAKGLQKLVDMLFKAGAKGSLRNALVDCALERAAFRHDLEVARMLIKAGADVNAAGVESGKRPIALAREKKDTEMIRLLKRAGAVD